jgi:hypothetical protein
MDRLNQLRREYEYARTVLEFPFSIEERQRHVERRNAILMEARALAASLNITGKHWFDAEQ